MNELGESWSTLEVAHHYDDTVDSDELCWHELEAGITNIIPNPERRRVALANFVVRLKDKLSS